MQSEPPISFGDLREANVQRCESIWHPISEWSPTDWATATAGELGEACNFIKRLRRLEHDDGRDFAGRGPDTQAEIVAAIAHELADTVIYLDLLAVRLGIDLGEAVRVKFNLVSDRMQSEIRL